MANEFNITYTGANTPYVIIRLVSDATVWDWTATAWQAWADSGVTDASHYGVMTDDSGSFWSADMPSDIADGSTMRVFFYERVGGTATTSDLLLDTRVITKTSSGATPTPPGSASITLTEARNIVLDACNRSPGDGTAFSNQRVDRAIQFTLQYSNAKGNLLSNSNTAAITASTATVNLATAITGFHPSLWIGGRLSVGAGTAYDPVKKVSYSYVRRLHEQGGSSGSTSQPTMIGFETPSVGVLHPTPDSNYTMAVRWKSDISNFTPGTASPGSVTFAIPAAIIRPILYMGASAALQHNLASDVLAQDSFWHSFEDFLERHIDGFGGDQGAVYKENPDT